MGFRSRLWLPRLDGGFFACGAPLGGRFYALQSLQVERHEVDAVACRADIVVIILTDAAMAIDPERADYSSLRDHSLLILALLSGSVPTSWRGRDAPAALMSWVMATRAFHS